MTQEEREKKKEEKRATAECQKAGKIKYTPSDSNVQFEYRVLRAGKLENKLRACFSRTAPKQRCITFPVVAEKQIEKHPHRAFIGSA